VDRVTRAIRRRSGPDALHVTTPPLVNMQAYAASGNLMRGERLQVSRGRIQRAQEGVVLADGDS